MTLGLNRTEWVADSTKQLDYWITAGDTPAQIEENYSAVTGRVPMMRDDVMGFWQCKLRYRNQEELLARGPQVQGAGRSPGRDRHRLLPLDQAGRVEV